MIEAPKTLPLPETDYPAPPTGGQLFEGLGPNSNERLPSILPQDPNAHKPTPDYSNPSGVVVEGQHY